MSTELFVLMIILAIGGLGISAGSLAASIKGKTCDSAAGYGALSVLFFIGTVGTICSMIGAFVK